MLKGLIFRFLKHKRIAPFALRSALKLHNGLYSLSGELAKVVNGGRHPKHHLLRYQQWFSDHIEPGWVVLDVGSNTGSMAALMAVKARHVYGIEIVSKFVELARGSFGANNLEFLCGDATAFDYSACRPIDCVTLSNVLEHIQNRSEFLMMLRRRLRWQNPAQCRFLIRVPTIERDWLAPYKKQLQIEYRLDRTHEIEYTREEFLTEVSEAGLCIETFDVRFGEFYAVCKGRAA